MNTPIINYLVGMGMVATLALIPKKIYWLYGKDKKEKVKILPYIAASLPAIYTIFYEVYLQLYGKPNLNQNFKFQLPWLKDWRIKLIFLVGIISIFGVANEVVELILDLLNFSQYSRDRFDTWIDLVANTSGALVSFYASLKFNKKASL